MRVSAESKAKTRARIVEEARRLFAANGFEATTTRDIAQAAEIATGTLFNYFQTKEAIVACLANEALGDTLAKFEHGSHADRTLEEDLFALVALGLRKLKPLRKHLPTLLETTLNPLVEGSTEESATFRTTHLAGVARIVAGHGFPESSAVALQMYWTLYTGILVFWANDKSSRQEETLALIDHSMNMFASWVREQSHTSRNSARTK